MPRDLLVMLPPAMATAQELLERGFAAALPIEVEVVDARADDYLDKEIGARLESQIMEKPHARLWLMGISLGGWGCLSVARRRPAEIEGLILIAPFLGSRNPPPLEGGLPPIYLGFGDADRYRKPSEMLARQLPAGRVVTLPGGHDWETWMRLWRALLAKGLFTVHA